jgi:hypothetical protein
VRSLSSKVLVEAGEASKLAVVGWDVWDDDEYDK